MASSLGRLGVRASARAALAAAALTLSTGRVVAVPPQEIFDWAWGKTSREFHDSRAVARVFTPATAARLRSELGQAASLDEVAAALNPLLDSLHVSHTHLFLPSDPVASIQQSINGSLSAAIRASVRR